MYTMCMSSHVIPGEPDVDTMGMLKEMATSLGVSMLQSRLLEERSFSEICWATEETMNVGELWKLYAKSLVGGCY